MAKTVRTLSGQTSGELLRDHDTSLRGKPKLAEKVALDIEREILRRGWPVGQIIGSEKELLAKHQVSRGILREAVRLLEHHLVATMRPGPGGGLVVTAPDAAAVTGAVAMYLEYQRAAPTVVFEARMALELVAVQMATERIDETKINKLRAQLAREEATDPSEYPSHSHDWAQQDIPAPCLLDGQAVIFLHRKGDVYVLVDLGGRNFGILVGIGIGIVLGEAKRGGNRERRNRPSASAHRAKPTSGPRAHKLAC